MIKIYTAMIQRTNSDDVFQYSEVDSEEYGEQWNGDVLGYVENLDLEDGDEINGDYDGSIANLPNNAVVLVRDGCPVEIWWPVEVTPGALLGEAIENAGLTQSQLSTLSGIPASNISEFISGVRDLSQAYVSTVLSLCRALGISVESLFL